MAGVIKVAAASCDGEKSECGCDEEDNGNIPAMFADVPKRFGWMATRDEAR